MRHGTAILVFCFSTLTVSTLSTFSAEAAQECRDFETPRGIDEGRTMRAFRSNDWKERSRAVRCMSLSEQAGTLLLAVVQDPDPRVKRTAMFALGERQAASPLFVKLLDDPDTLVRSVAARYAHLSGAAAVEPLMRLASDKGAPIEQRVLALGTLERLGSIAAPKTAQLVALLDDSDESVRIASIRVLGMLGTDGRAAIAPMRQRLARLPSTSLEAQWIRESMVRLDPQLLSSFR